MTTRRCPICQNPISTLSQNFYCSPACEEQAHVEQVAWRYVLGLAPCSSVEFAALLQDALLRDWAREIVWLCGVLEFMVCEDYTFADVHSRQVYLTEAAIQPLPEISAAWQEVFWEYKIVPLTLHLPQETHLPQFQHVTRPWTLQQAVIQIEAKIQSEPQATSLQAILARMQKYQKSTWLFYQQAALENPALPLDVLRQYAHHPLHYCRASVAANRNLPADLFVLLAHDHDPLVRQAIALNPRTPPTILLMLIEDAVSYVAESVPMNHGLTPAMLQQWTQHPNPQVRAIVQEHLNFPLS